MSNLNRIETRFLFGVWVAPDCMTSVFAAVLTCAGCMHSHWGDNLSSWSPQHCDPCLEESLVLGLDLGLHQRRLPARG